MILRVCARWLLALLFLLAGINHFRMPELYVSMIPPWVPWPHLMNQISGAAEIAGGLGIVIPCLRQAAGWGLIALLVAVFPANIHLAIHGWDRVDLPMWVYWVRLPFQALFIAWVWWTCLSAAPLRNKTRSPAP